MAKASVEFLGVHVAGKSLKKQYRHRRIGRLFPHVFANNARVIGGYSRSIEVRDGVATISQYAGLYFAAAINEIYGINITVDNAFRVRIVPKLPIKYASKPYASSPIRRNISGQRTIMHTDRHRFLAKHTC